MSHLLPCLILIMALGQNAYTQDENTDPIRMFLRLDRLEFYKDDKIPLRVVIKNVSDRDSSFDIYEKNGDPNSNYISFQPVVLDMKGKEAEITVPYKMENKDPRDFLKEYTKRTIQIGPGEEFTHLVNLPDIYTLETGTRYRVKCFFFPDFQKDEVVRSDNEISFRILSGKISDIKSGIITRYQRKVDIPEMLPSEVVFLVLNGEKTNSLHRFIKYFNIEKYINAYPNYVRKYQNASEEKKSKIEDEFITFLIRNRSDYITDYKIKKEEIDEINGVAYVDVFIERFAPRKSFRYSYRYTLEKTMVRNVQAWLITNLDATVVKGEMR